MKALQLAFVTYVITAIFALMVAAVFKGLAALIKKMDLDKDSPDELAVATPENHLARVAAIAAAVQAHKRKK